MADTCHDRPAEDVGDSVAPLTLRTLSTVLGEDAAVRLVVDIVDGIAAGQLLVDAVVTAVVAVLVAVLLEYPMSTALIMLKKNIPYITSIKGCRNASMTAFFTVFLNIYKIESIFISPFPLCRKTVLPDFLRFVRPFFCHVPPQFYRSS